MVGFQFRFTGKQRDFFHFADIDRDEIIFVETVLQHFGFGKQTAA